MPTPTVENYLKQIYLLSEESDHLVVPMGLLAERMAVVPGTATTMVKSLMSENWVKYQPRIGVRLTDEGRAHALQVLRKHRIVEMFLVKVLGLDWSEIHEEAELLEHAISDKLVERMDAFLDRPSVDPHGDPIPTSSGDIAQRAMFCLLEASEGETVKIAQITRQDSAFLQFIFQKELTPGTRLIIEGHDSVADVIHVRLFDNKSFTLGSKAASHILVQTENS